MQFQQIHFAINTTTNQVEIFGTKYLPCTNYKGSRLSYTPINLSLEKCGPTKIVSWANECPGHGQDSQLQYTLGDGWKVLSQYDAVSMIKDAFKLQTLTDQLKANLRAIKRS